MSEPTIHDDGTVEVDGMIVAKIKGDLKNITADSLRWHRCPPLTEREQLLNRLNERWKKHPRHAIDIVGLDKPSF